MPPGPGLLIFLRWRPHRAGFPAEADDSFAVPRCLPQFQGLTPPGNRKWAVPIMCSFYVICLFLATRRLCCLAGFSLAVGVGARPSRAARASRRDGCSCCPARALGHRAFSGCSKRASAVVPGKLSSVPFKEQLSQKASSRLSLASRWQSWPGKRQLSSMIYNNQDESS